MPTRTTAVTTWVARLTGRLSRHAGPHTADRVAAAVVLAGSALALVVSVGYGLHSGNQIGPGFFPALVSASLAVLSVIWLVQGNTAARPDRTDDASTDEAIDGPGRTRILFVVAWSAVTAAFTERLGIVPVLTVYLAGLLIMVARTRPIRSIVLSLVGTLVACYGLQALGIFLPDPFGLLTVPTRLGIGP